MGTILRFYVCVFHKSIQDELTFISFRKFTVLVRPHCSAIIKQPCLNKAKNGKDQREYINSENDFYKHFQACK